MPIPDMHECLETHTLLERNRHTEEDQPTKEALLPQRTSARVKCTYGETYLPIEAQLR
jgi:hypothetical protein